MRPYTHRPTDSAITRYAQPREHRVRPVIYREDFLKLTQSWQSDTEAALCRRVIRISKWAIANGGLMSDERIIVDMMVAHIAKLVE